MKRNWTKPTIISLEGMSIKSGNPAEVYPYEVYAACGYGPGSTCVTAIVGNTMNYTTGQATNGVTCTGGAGPLAFCS